MAKLIFQHHYSSLQYHMILQNTSLNDFMQVGMSVLITIPLVDLSTCLISNPQLQLTEIFPSFHIPH